MDQNNTLFLIARFGLKMTPEKGILESWMWILDPPDSKMKYVSFHKTKADRAYKGGELIGTREPSEAEYEEHQALMRKLDEGQMESREGRKILIFRLIPSWKMIWPQAAKLNPMAYKALGYVSPPS
jgi:hypothetical protein